ncbi:MAG: bifunctional 4-hydroxy-3-methylbut-2-enyl diphosphate reductase/30S ribosomal protein S1 [Clostridia bacterium]|nr:bifunctional 4-hydroxy-3-methylbut-2-enyl diphosphate reductase/30S ribosomal protein S1 [Clostridia bacterium]
MPIEVAAHAGFCMGVRRAVEEAMRVAASGVPSCTLGELAHNPVVVDMLRERGVPPIHTPEEAQGRQVLIRSHGVSPDVLAALADCGSPIIDLTCPFVARLHQIVADGTADGTPVIMVGEREHPEVKGTCGWACGDVYVVATEEEAAALPEMPCAIAAAQTTYPPERWEAITAILRQKVRQLREHCTICNATPVRQREAKELAARADAMIVVGGHASANTQKLYAACKALCPRTIQVECAAEIPPAFANTESDFIGITAGASTPAGSLEEVYTHMTDIQNTEFTMDVIDASMTRIRPGQNVTGKVILVREDAVVVSIGYKSDGVIKMSDLTQEDVKEGDEIEAEVVKVNDGDGNVVLSQRNIVNRKAWEALMVKHAAGEYVEGVGKEAVKGGLICDVEGVRAFVPASQLAQHYVEKIGEFVGKDMRLKIIEVDEKKKRIVASRKAVIVEETAAKEKAAWERLEKGIIIHGVVRRLTNFGAFVDVGGVDGLIHITDLSWVRVGHPSEVVKPNQEIDVVVLNLDPERKRIQLGYKQLQPRPWDNAAERYPEGCIVEGKVLRTVDFGAFVELQPGLDGLVHISQCSTTHISKVTDAVQAGQIVRVKVLSVDTDKKRISLSIRQAIEDEVFDEEIEPVVDEAEAENVTEFSSEE